MAAGSRRFIWALLGLALTLAWPVVYMLAVESPTARSTGWPAFAVAIAGVAVCAWAALGDRRVRVLVPSVLSVLVLAAWTGLFFVGLKVPATPAFAALTRAPDFTLPDHAGRPVTLASARSGGPVLLVFYRGFW